MRIPPQGFYFSSNLADRVFSASTSFLHSLVLGELVPLGHSVDSTPQVPFWVDSLRRSAGGEFASEALLAKPGPPAPSLKLGGSSGRAHHVCSHAIYRHMSGGLCRAAACTKLGPLSCSESLGFRSESLGFRSRSLGFRSRFLGLARSERCGFA